MERVKGPKGGDLALFIDPRSSNLNTFPRWLPHQTYFHTPTALSAVR